MLENIIRKAKEEGKKVNVYAHKFPDGDAISTQVNKNDISVILD